MNEIVDNVLLAGDKVTPEMHIACGPFTKNK